ncbi:hypothetical protein BT93_G2365 [Corymbia citriodora subsp. variegata]|nr:hypothetical protein BT93_G2365 [Corymbia citriodora subsp. variegata]
MCDLVARTGRHHQRYEAGCRLVAGSPCPWVDPVENSTLLGRKKCFVSPELWCISWTMLQMWWDIAQMKDILGNWKVLPLLHSECCFCLFLGIKYHPYDSCKGYSSFAKGKKKSGMNVESCRRCIPYRYRQSVDCTSDTDEKIVEVLMINSTSGSGLLFPKGGWENDETVEEAAVREAIEEAGVKGDLKVYVRQQCLHCM